MSLRWIRLWAVDPRSTSQVRADVAAEFEHHMDCLRDELVRRGVAADEIEATVAARFGDAATYARACERIALKERLMLQRINLVLLVLVSVLIGWNAWASSKAAGKNADALEKLAARLDAMDPSKRTSAGDAAAALGRDAAPREVVAVAGSATIGRPGLYAHTENLSLRRLLIAAQFSPELWKSERPVQVLRMGPPGINNVVFTLTREEFLDATGKDYVLAPGDAVQAP